MYKSHKISIAVPAYNEEGFIKKTLTTIPEYVDMIIAVNDKSKDKTKKQILECKKKDKRIRLIDSANNEGIGGSVVKAYIYAIEKKCKIGVVMAGDNQMDPHYLTLLLDKLIDNNVDYVKGNRFFHLEDLRSMPLIRNIGNIFITFLTKFSTGYWSIADPLNGYAAINLKTFKRLKYKRIEKRYDFELSLLTELALVNAKVHDVFIPARYGDEKSDVNIFVDSYRALRTLIKGYIRRMIYKYTLYNFHPISLFYISGFLLLFIGICFGLYIILYYNGVLHIIASPATVMLSVIPFLLGFQLILQAIVLDIQNEPK